MNKPIFNITVTVFNRFHLTQKTILHLIKLKNRSDFSITVVDNGSEDQLRKRLIEFADDKIIDNLFLLDRNMGAAFSTNLGWKTVDAKIFVKLDNDITIINNNLLLDILFLYQIFDETSSFGCEPEVYGRSPEVITTPLGKIGICTSNLPGVAIFVPKKLLSIVGYFNEDYGLYGADDADYGYRMNYTGFKQYFFETKKYLIHEGSLDSSEYVKFNFDKKREKSELIRTKDGGIGLLALNFCLYELSIRNWNVPLRYTITQTDKYYAHVEEREEYQKVKDALENSKTIFDKIIDKSSKKIILTQLKLSENVISELKDIWNTV